MDDVAPLRSFNRSVTQRIGVLAESYLDAGRPLGPSRLLFEIGSDVTAVADLRRRLGLDSGYLSRLIRELERDDLAVVAPDPADGRRRVVRLTPTGRREWRRLDRRAEKLAHDLLDPLSDRQRAELATALATADRLLRAATVTIDRVDPSGADASAALSQYFRELDERFRTGFDLGEAGTDNDAAALRPPDGAFLVVRCDQTPIGCGGLQRIDARAAEIKRMWVHRDWRGLGLGRRLLVRLEGLAGELGRTRVLLDTNDSLTEAIAMYERAGYRATSRYNDNPYAHHWFTKDLAR